MSAGHTACSAPDAERVRRPRSGRDDRRSGAGLVTSCLVRGPTSERPGVYFRGVYLTEKLTEPRNPRRRRQRGEQRDVGREALRFC